MQKDDILTVKIEKLSNLAKGIAKYEGQVIFIENVCPEDEVKIQITKVNKNYATAKVIEILTPSSHRIKPFCPLQNICGSCQLQFIDYQYQLELKQQIVEDAIKSIAKLNTPINFPIPSPQIKAFRHKTQCPVTQTKVSKKLLAGYYKTQSHEIVNIKYCPIQPKICDEVIGFIRDNSIEYGISGYNENKHTGDLRHIIIRHSADNGTLLVTLVINSNKITSKLKAFAKTIFEQFKEVVGVCINFNNKKTNVILGEKTECIIGEDFIYEKILDKIFKIGSSTFFQVNPKSAENIFNYVKEEVAKFKNPTVLDAYAGIATFGITISDVANKITSVEENPESIEKAKAVLKLNNINMIQYINSHTIIAISNDNVVTCLTEKGVSGFNFLNNNNYKYKKIITTEFGVAALTHEGVVVYFGDVVSSVIDHSRFAEVDDIEYANNGDIAIIKGGKKYSLFHSNED